MVWESGKGEEGGWYIFTCDRFVWGEQQVLTWLCQLWTQQNQKLRFIRRAAGLTPCCYTGFTLMQTCPLKVLSPGGASFLLTRLSPLLIQGCAFMAAFSSLIATGAHLMVSSVGWQSWRCYCSGGDELRGIRSNSFDVGEERSRAKPHLHWHIARKRCRMVTKCAAQKLEHGAALKVSLRNVFMAAEGGLLQGVPVSANSAPSGNISGQLSFLSGMWGYRG